MSQLKYVLSILEMKREGGNLTNHQIMTTKKNITEVLTAYNVITRKLNDLNRKGKSQSFKASIKKTFTSLKPIEEDVTNKLIKEFNDIILNKKSIDIDFLQKKIVGVREIAKYNTDHMSSFIAENPKNLENQGRENKSLLELL